MIDCILNFLKNFYAFVSADWYKLVQSGNDKLLINIRTVNRLKIHQEFRIHEESESTEVKLIL